MNRTENYILVVDDNIENLQVVAKLLKEKGYLLSLAQSGADALEQAKAHTPHLILLDIMMPEMDGFEVCKILKSNDATKEIPIVFLTALTETNDIVRGFELGGVDYITKPFVKAELLVRVKTHLDLYLSKKQIIEFNKNRDLVYKIISHDIRTPFNKISQIITLLKEGLINPASNEFEEIIGLLYEQNLNTLNIINSLIEWIDVLRNKGFVLSESVVFDAVNSALAPCITSIKEKNINIVNKIPENTKALFEKASLEIVLRNLISNAVKFTPEGGTITISTEEVNDAVIISVSDTGVGIIQEIIEKILEKNEFYTTSGTNNEKGSGLGLQIVKDFIKKNNGKLTVKSDGLRGSTFSILLKK